MNDERIQSIVLEAIKSITGTDKPERYASMNYSSYEIAYKAVVIALEIDLKSFLKNKYTLWKEYPLSGNDSMKIKISGLAEIYEDLFGEEIQ